MGRNCGVNKFVFLLKLWNYDQTFGEKSMYKCIYMYIYSSCQNLCQANAKFGARFLSWRWLQVAQGWFDLSVSWDGSIKATLIDWLVGPKTHHFCMLCKTSKFVCFAKHIFSFSGACNTLNPKPKNTSFLHALQNIKFVCSAKHIFNFSGACKTLNPKP
jgi:hypothetical protein